MGKQDITYDEWRKAVDEVAEELTYNDPSEPPQFDARYSRIEYSDGLFPYGGDIMVSCFYDKSHNPTTEGKAKYINTLIFDKHWQRINEVYGVLDEP